MSSPAWADALVQRVCADAGVAPPRLRWLRRDAEHSTGVARRHEGTIAVRAGRDATDVRLTLLHELAHWIAPRPRRHGGRSLHHGPAFYAVAFDLYRRHGVPTADALRLESGRYPSALRHAAALGVDGAIEALVARRSDMRNRPRPRWRVVVPEHRIRLERDGRWSVCADCGQRVVGRTLARVRRARRPMHHVLFGAVHA